MAQLKQETNRMLQRAVLAAGVVACLGLAACSDKKDTAAAPAAAAEKVKAGKWTSTTEMAGPVGAQALAGMEQALKQMSAEQKKAANMETARIENGKLVQEMCITPEMAKNSLASVADSQLKSMPGCGAPETSVNGKVEAMTWSCSDGKFKLSLQANYASPTENTVNMTMTTPGGAMETKVSSKRLGDC